MSVNGSRRQPAQYGSDKKPAGGSVKRAGQRKVRQGGGRGEEMTSNVRNGAKQPWREVKHDSHGIPFTFVGSCEPSIGTMYRGPGERRKQHEQQQPAAVKKAA